jgi:hypothetical protein
LAEDSETPHRLVRWRPRPCIRDLRGISERSPRPEPKECDSRVPERDVKHANHRNAHSREVTVRSGAGRSRGCVQCPVRLRDSESNLVTREGWCKRQERSPQWPSPNGRDLKRGLDDEPTCPAFGHAGFPCWWSPPGGSTPNQQHRPGLVPGLSHIRRGQHIPWIWYTPFSATRGIVGPRLLRPLSWSDVVQGVVVQGDVWGPCSLHSAEATAWAAGLQESSLS